MSLSSSVFRKLDKVSASLYDQKRDSELDSWPASGIIMTNKAKKLRRKGNGLKVVYAEQEREQKSPREMFKVSLTRPYVFLFTEPITYLAAAING